MISDHILHGNSPVTKNFDNDELEFDYKNIERTIDNSIIYPKRKSIKYNTYNYRVLNDSSYDLTEHNKLSKKKSTRKKKKADKKKIPTKRKQRLKKRPSTRKKKSATRKKKSATRKKKSATKK